jgi:integrase
MAMLMLLERMKRDDLTTHGFRSTFRDWAAECTAFPNEVAEMALAHAIRNKTESAYRRGDLLDKRRELMQAWADYIDQQSGANVIPLHDDATVASSTRSA